MGIDVTFERMGAADEIGRAWTVLESRSDASFFQSWGWIATWLDLVGGRDDVYCLTARRNGEITGLGLFVARGGRAPSRTLYLHETGHRALDHLNVEHNGLLIDRNAAAETLEASLRFVAGHLDEGSAQKIVLGGVPAGYQTPDAAVFVRRREPSFHVDLEKVRRAGDYTALLGQSTRKNMRRSRRFYERWGPMIFECARTPAEASSYLARLIDLHESVWAARGHFGSFANPAYRDFHRAIIDRRFEAGEVQLARICAGDHEVGYLYNFVYRDRVYAYQAGLRYEEDGVFQPGRMCDWLAVEHAAQQGLAVYDFLAGDTQYKRTLGTGADERVWIVLARRGANFAAERGRRAALSAVRPIRQALPRPARAVAEALVARIRWRAASTARRRS